MVDRAIISEGVGIDITPCAKIAELVAPDFNDRGSRVQKEPME